MSTFPALESALDAAAHRHYGRRRRSRWRVLFAAPAVALACALVALVFMLAPAREGDIAQDPAVIVPERTLVLSHALTAAPRESEQFIGHNALAGVAADIALSVPYPPESRDTFDWEATPPGPYDMSSINYRDEVQSLVETRSSCLWMGFWDFAWRSGNEAALTAATTVLGDVASWPSFRGDRYRLQLAGAAAARDPAPLRKELELNCSRVAMPWR